MKIFSFKMCEKWTWWCRVSRERWLDVTQNHDKCDRDTLKLPRDSHDAICLKVSFICSWVSGICAHKMRLFGANTLWSRKLYTRLMMTKTAIIVTMKFFCRVNIIFKLLAAEGCMFCTPLCYRPCVYPRLYVSAISPVSIDGFSPSFCHWCILAQRRFGIKGEGHNHYRSFLVTTLHRYAVDKGNKYRGEAYLFVHRPIKRWSCWQTR